MIAESLIEALVHILVKPVQMQCHLCHLPSQPVDYRHERLPVFRMFKCVAFRRQITHEDRLDSMAHGTGNLTKNARVGILPERVSRN